MEIKFKKSLDQYKYLIMFDLASKITGVCIWDLQKHFPIQTNIIKVTGKKELPVAELYELLDEYFKSLTQQNINLQDVLVSFEAAPSQAGKFTTVQTLLALGKAHSALDLYCYNNELSEYDYVGVAPVTTHAYFKHLMEWDNKHPVTKEDIRDYLYSKYQLHDLTLDESDAVFLAQTLIESKWNRDIDEEIKSVKKHRKTLKAAHAINLLDNEIKRLSGLKNAF